MPAPGTGLRTPETTRAKRLAKTKRLVRETKCPHRTRRLVHELVENANANVESIAKREGCSVRQVNMTISLAFLAPALVKAAIEGRLPRGIGVTRLRDAPVEWSRQQAMLGLIG